MIYKDFYINTKRRTTEALLSMWAAGKKHTQEYLKQIFEEEPILAEPVFQSMFPWQSDTRKFEEFKNIFDDMLINALSGIEDKKFKFPKDRKPYTHQAESWKQLLNDEKSIVVTSGTGSGKTECFMLPIIQDLIKQQQSNYGNDKKGGIQAIFLYPLNALMSSQQKRMSAWCKAVNPQVSFAMYKGDTEENYKQIMKDALPELKSREQIRKTPPQILFTNPTMLEYMLVRKQDKTILDVSKQKKSLRWIVLDEAHTYSGSSAAELALQIRRILDAFGVTIDDVRFAATSATLGSGVEDEYKNFLSRVTGKKQQDIVVIHGNQIIPEIDIATLNPIISEINRDFDGKFKLSNDKILALREELRYYTLSAREITNRFSTNQNISIEDDLSLIDRLSEKNDVLLSDIDRRGALLPTRAHFFVRNMGGLYACVNPECSKHKETRIDLGSLTTNAQTECTDCLSKLIEVKRCNSCGNLLLVGQEQDNYYGFAKRETQSLFEIENNDDSTEEGIDNNLDDAILFILAKGVTEKPISNSALVPRVIDVKEGKIKSGESDFVECHKSNGTIICPHCGERTDKLQSMYSGNLFSRLLAPTLLEQTAPETDDKTALWQGRKYISFTDNRQGTAKSTFQQNIEVERNWIRTSIYHYLSDERRKTIIPAQGLADAEEKELYAIKQFNPDSPRVIDLEKKKYGNTRASNPQKLFTDFANAITSNSELIKLYSHLPDSFKNGRDENAYLKQLMIDQFGRRPRKAGVNNPETMGLIKVVYPAIEKATMPEAIESIFNNLKWNEQDWKDFLKITLDYFFRENRYIEVPIDTKRFRTQAFINSDVYPSGSNQKKKFPSLSIKNNDTVKNPNRLVTLLLLAMEINKEEEISLQHETYINQILSATWNFLRQNVLNPNTDEERGYKLDLLGDKVAYQIIDKAWICPVNQAPLDTIFRGYSPLLTSRITSNLEKYKITETPIEYPYFPYAYKNDNYNNRIDDNTIINWISKNLKQVQNKGLWSNLHERILLNNPVYLSAEHTAQQNKDVLRKIEDDFEKHKLNVLSCSTTMEMGVDISGISEVVMNNVPPKPANYLQRAGRAGRGSETKALALTFCAPCPIGSNLFNNQKWAMTHKTAVPMVSFDSNMLVQRHINSFMLSTYIATDGENDLTVSSSVNNFFFTENGRINHQEQFCKYLKNIILNGNTTLCERYKELVKDTCKHTVPFADSVTACLSDLERIRKDLVDKKTMLDGKIKQLKAARYDESSPATMAISSQLHQILRQNILGFFAEHNFIPSAGIPTGIVDFDKYNIADYKIEKNKKEEKDKEGYEYHFGYQQANPSMLLTQAISEYAPGNQIVLNEACYVSRGIVLKSQWDNARRVIFQHCPRCGYAITKEGDTLSKCPHCKNENLKGIKSSPSNFAPLIEPAGFRVDFSEEPTRTINSHNSKNYTQPELLNMPPWDEQDEQSNARLELRYSNQSNAEILYYNLGNGNGYAVCLECGRAVPDIKEDNLSEALHKLHLYDHTPIIGGKKAKEDKEKCSNKHIKRNVLLGGRFQTDFIEIRFRDERGKPINDEETIFSLGVILTQKLTEKTGVNSQEINFGIKQYHNYSSIFIYDTAKGGAGYSIRFNELKEEVINLSKATLENCKCEKACDKCLINREAQWALDKLNRQKALEWLKLEIQSRNQAPDTIKSKFSNNVYSITTSLSSEIYKISVNLNLSKIIFFIDNDIENWKPEVWELYELAKRLKKNGISISFAFQQPTNNLRKLSASQLSVLAVMRMSFSLLTYNRLYNGIEYLMIAEFSEAKQPIFYFSEANKISDKYDESWSQGSSYIYKVTLESNRFNFTSWNPNFDFTKIDDNFIMFDLKITEKSPSRSLAKKITSFETEKWNAIFEKISNTKVNASYTDIYLKSPLSCRILIDIVNWFVKEANLKVVNFNLYLAEVKNRREDDFYYTELRDDYLATYANYFGLIPNLKKSGKLPHYRELKFESSEFDFIIRPDGGFENGWTVEWADKSSDWQDNYNADIRLHNLSVNIGGILYTIAYRRKND
jgi:DEAD/DEAH box helicase domain-containing protein